MSSFQLCYFVVRIEDEGNRLEKLKEYLKGLKNDEKIE